MTCGVFVDFAKLLRPSFSLVAADSDPCDIVCLEANRFVHNPPCFVDSEVADRVEDPIERHAEVALATLASTLGAFEQRSEFLASPMHHAGRDIDLGMNNALRVQLLHHAISNQFVVVGGAQPLGDGLEGQHEAGEILVRI